MYNGKRSLSVPIIAVGFFITFLIISLHFFDTNHLNNVEKQTSSKQKTNSLTTKSKTDSQFEKYIHAANNGKLSFPNATLLPIIDKRTDLGRLLNDEQKLTGAEIGVKQGHFSKTILRQWVSCTKYYLIDPWEYQTDYHDVANVEQKQQDTFFEQTKQNVKLWENNVVIKRQYSVDAAKSIPDNELDFVYLDARHDYRSILEDLETYWPKLKVGGIFSGHDFCNAHEEPKKSKQDWCIFSDGTRCEQNKAVKAAVEEFAQKVNRQIVTPRRETIWVSWYMRK